MENQVGYRFHPTDEELVNHYLKHKLLRNDMYVRDAINEVDIYNFEPWDLWRKSKIRSDNQVWYFFCRVDYKYPKSKRVNRTTIAGYWKGTGQPREIKTKDRSSRVIGGKRTLVFHKGRVPNGEKTDWVMHEYYSSLWPCDQGEYVLCKIKYKGTSPLPTGFVDAVELCDPAPSDSLNHAALLAALEIDEQIQEQMAASSDHIEIDDNLLQHLSGQFQGVSSQDIGIQDNPFNGYNWPPGSFDSIQDQEIYDYEAEMSNDEEFVNSLLAEPVEPFFGGSHVHRSNTPMTINCITKLDRVYSPASSSETYSESPPLEILSSSSETSECPTPRRQILLDRTSGACATGRGENFAVQKLRKGGAALSAVDVDLPEKTSKKDLEKQQFGDIRKRKGFRAFLETKEIHQEPYPLVVYLRNLVVGMILLVILVREVMVIH